MATGSTPRILRAPGRICLNPTESFSAENAVFPYGGTEIGLVKSAAVFSRRTLLPVMCEGLGEPGDWLEGEPMFTFSCFLRGWDDDGIASLMNYASAEGAVTQHQLWAVPGPRAGRSARTRAVKLLYEPDDKLNVPGCIVYFGIPDLDEGSEISFSRDAELGFPLTLICHRASTTSLMMAIGRVQDLNVNG
jgi:hypothetical protein